MNASICTNNRARRSCVAAAVIQSHVFRCVISCGPEPESSGFSLHNWLNSAVRRSIFFFCISVRSWRFAQAKYKQTTEDRYLRVRIMMNIFRETSIFLCTDSVYVRRKNIICTLIIFCLCVCVDFHVCIIWRVLIQIINGLSRRTCVSVCAGASAAKRCENAPAHTHRANATTKQHDEQIIMPIKKNASLLCLVSKW